MRIDFLFTEVKMLVTSLVKRTIFQSRITKLHYLSKTLHIYFPPLLLNLPFKHMFLKHSIILICLIILHIMPFDVSIHGCVTCVPTL